jgi:hypothetical protein
MVTQTTTATAATTTVRPSTPPTISTTTQATTTASQQIAGHLQTALWRTSGGPGGPGGNNDPTGPGGPGGPRGPGEPAPAAAPAALAAAAPVNRDDRLMGSLPPPYEGDRRLTRTFLDQLVHYFWANALVPGIGLSIRKVSIALTLFQGQQTTAWVRDMGAWINSLD